MNGSLPENILDCSKQVARLIDKRNEQEINIMSSYKDDKTYTNNQLSFYKAELIRLLGEI